MRKSLITVEQVHGRDTSFQCRKAMDFYFQTDIFRKSHTMVYDEF